MGIFYGTLLFFCVVGLLALLFVAYTKASAEKRLVVRRLSVRGNSKEDARLLSMKLADMFDDEERVNSFISKDKELALALWRAGLRSSRQRSVVYGIQVLLPLVIALLFGIWVLIHGYTQTQLLIGVFVVIIAVLAPKRVISSMAEDRMRRIDNELSLFVQMLRILFDAGLAVEQTLRVMAKEGGQVLPELVKELQPVLSRAEQGLDLETELAASADALDCTGYTDVTVIIRQMLKQGGSARASLAKLIEVMESRRLTDMQEKVSKLSAKMTVVMIVFFFPALIILLAGPGFISIGDAMGDM